MRIYVLNPAFWRAGPGHTITVCPDPQVNETLSSVGPVDWLANIVGAAIGISVCLFVRHQFLSRPALARRWPAYRNLLASSALLAMFAVLAWFLSLTAGTSSHAARRDALLFGGVGLLLLVTAAGLFVVWWRLAGDRTHDKA